MLVLCTAGILSAALYAEFFLTLPFERGRRDTIVNASRQAAILNVREDLRGRATFSGYTETGIENLPDGRYGVRGWIDLMDDSGVRERREYRATVTRDARGQWRADDVVVGSQ